MIAENFTIRVMEFPLSEEFKNQAVAFEQEIFGDSAIRLWELSPFAHIGWIHAAMDLQSGELVGLMETLPDKQGWLYVYGLAVAPKWRGRGLGKALLRQLEIAASATVPRPAGIFLFVSPDNGPALRLYEKGGFTLRSHHPRFFGLEEDRLLYAREL